MIAALLIFMTALLLCAFYAGFETGLYSMEQVRLRVLAAGGDRRARRLLHWFGRKGRAVVLMLLGNNVAHWFVSFAGSMLVAVVFPAIDSVDRELWNLCCVVPVVFVLGEVVPKTLFMRHPAKLMPLCLPLVEVSRVVLWIPAVILGGLLRRLFRGESQLTGLLGREEVATALAEAQASGQVSDSQKALADRVLALRRQHVDAIMVPIAQASWVDVAADAATVRAMASASGHTRLLVRAGAAGAVLGYVSVHDVSDTAKLGAGEKRRAIPELAVGTNSVAALDELRRRRCPLGLVMNRGRPVGVISTADIVDVLFRSAPLER